jgi:hypothetical protein
VRDDLQAGAGGDVKHVDGATAAPDRQRGGHLSVRALEEGCTHCDGQQIFTFDHFEAEQAAMQTEPVAPAMCAPQLYVAVTKSDEAIVIGRVR